MHSISGDNNLVPFHLWWREIVLKNEKVSKCFVQDCTLDIFNNIQWEKTDHRTSNNNQQMLQIHLEQGNNSWKWIDEFLKYWHQTIDIEQRRIENPVKHLRWSCCENSWQLSAVNYFRKTLYLRCMTGFSIPIRRKFFKIRNFPFLWSETFPYFLSLKFKRFFLMAFVLSNIRYFPLSPPTTYKSKYFLLSSRRNI